MSVLTSAGIHSFGDISASPLCQGFGSTRTVNVPDAIGASLASLASIFSVASLDSGAKQVDVLVGEEGDHQRRPGGRRCSHAELHLWRREGEEPRRHLVRGVELVRKKHRCAILAVDAYHVEVPRPRHIHLQHDLVADADRLSSTAGDLHRLTLGRERHERGPRGPLPVARGDQFKRAADQPLIAVDHRMTAIWLLEVRGDIRGRRRAQIIDGRMLAITCGVLDLAHDA
jgi:hypothetical protein